MGLEASIEKVFRRAMESDLELIAQNVSTQTSSNTTPQGSCMCACNVSASVIQPNDDSRPQEQLYSVQRIVFRPVENLPEIMAGRMRESAADRHGGHLDTLETLLKNGPTIRDRDKRRLAHNKALALVDVMAHHYQEEGPHVTIVVRAKGRVITMGVVDYVLAGLRRAQIDGLMRRNELRAVVIPALERWPKQVVIGGRRNRVYRRVDLALGLGIVPRKRRAPRPPRPRVGHPPPPWTLRQVVAGRI